MLDLSWPHYFLSLIILNPSQVLRLQWWLKNWQLQRGKHRSSSLVKNFQVFLISLSMTFGGSYKMTWPNIHGPLYFPGFVICWLPFEYFRDDLPLIWVITNVIYLFSVNLISHNWLYSWIFFRSSCSTWQSSFTSLYFSYCLSVILKHITMTCQFHPLYHE